MGLLNNTGPYPLDAPGKTNHIRERACSKKSVQQGRSPFGARSVLSVREHGKMARTPLAAFFNRTSMAGRINAKTGEPQSIDLKKLFFWK